MTTQVTETGSSNKQSLAVFTEWGAPKLCILPMHHVFFCSQVELEAQENCLATLPFVDGLELGLRPLGAANAHILVLLSHDNAAQWEMGARIQVFGRMKVHTTHIVIPGFSDAVEETRGYRSTLSEWGNRASKERDAHDPNVQSIKRRYRMASCSFYICALDLEFTASVASVVDGFPAEHEKEGDAEAGRRFQPFCYEIPEGDYIWIAPQCRGEFSIPIGAKILDIQNDAYIVEDDDGKQYSLRIDSDVQLMHPSSILSIPDMTALGELHECSILRNLFLRYRQNNIYTYTGSILIAINPYKSLPIYTEDTMKQYTNKEIGEMPPHLFAIGDNAFRNMLRNSRDQCIIISGESGAGKTESTKLLLQFITTLSGGEPCIGKRILDSNPIMEAFGNAKTVRNDNSSRFGKYVDIHFDQESGHIVSARIEQYLLEKSRIVRQAAGERNYHAFYCMLAGMPLRDRRRLGLKDARCYNYLCQANSPNDATHFENIVSTMRYLEFTDHQIDEIWHLLAALLHLGNISFCEILKESADASKVKDTHRSELRYASNLLGMSHTCLEKAMTTRRIQMAGECVVAQFLPANAYTVRDAFVKTIYDHLFCWIVEKINAAIYKPPLDAAATASTAVPLTKPGSCTSPVFTSPRLPASVDHCPQDYWYGNRVARSNTWPSAIDPLASPANPIPTSPATTTHISCELNPPLDPSAGPGRLSIGVLDIFGFENFISNSFEQLCINYANENIQQYFVRHIFKLEQDEYLTEGINWTHIKFRDNHEVLDLIAHQPLNVLALVDEESRFPRGSDASFLNKLNARHSTTPNFIRALSSAETRFGIVHFAGPVFYNVDGFLEKNRDTFNHDLLEVINTSKNEFLRKLFEKRLHSAENRPRSLTLGMQFKKSLERLMSIINGCHPFFVRCIKPNEFKLPSCFDRNLCVRQLRYSGMMETIQIRSLGYPIRYEFPDFVQRFHMILQLHGPTTYCFSQLRHGNPQHLVMEICRAAFGPEDLTYAIGSTKVFLRTSHDAKLEELRERIINTSAILIQSRWRGFLTHRDFENLRKHAIFCQRRFRQTAVRRRFLRAKHIIIRMQANVRARQARKRFIAQQHFILQLQSLARYWLSRQTLHWMMRKRGFFAETAIQYDEETMVCFCEAEVPEDAMLQSPLRAKCTSAPAPENSIELVSLSTVASEVCGTQQLSASFDIDHPVPTKLPRSETYFDLLSFVDSLFEEIFNSADFINHSHSEIAVSLDDSIQVKEGRHLDSADAITGHKTFEEPKAGTIASLSPPASMALMVGREGREGGGGCGSVGLGNGHFSTRCSAFFPVSPHLTELQVSSLSRPASTEAVAEADVTGGPIDIDVAPNDAHVAWGECSYLKFAAAYFQTGVLPTFSSVLLTRPLFKHRSQHDIALALKIFGKIVSFMRPKNINHNSKSEDSISTVNGSTSDRMGESGMSSAAQHSVSSCPRVVISSANGSRRDIPLTDYRDDVLGNVCSSYTPTVRICHDCQPVLSELHKVRYIVGTGVDHPQMRDEIYCQILKQITNNPCVYSRSRGWILLILCTSCFPPTRFDTALRTYLKSNTSDYAKTCLKRLNRIHQTGARSMPPSYMELRAEQEKKSLGVNVLCANSNRVRVKVDPTITVQEFSSIAFSAASIKDTFGFEIFIEIFDKFEALSLGPRHFFDNISLCEEYTRRKGLSEFDMPWSFFIRKTIFAPWHDVTFDAVATSLICFQVIQQCFKESHDSLEEHELAYLLANIYRLLAADSNGLGTSDKCDLQSWLNQILSPDCDTSFWRKVTSTALCELNERSPEASTTAMCENIVTFAKLQWPSVFTRKFSAIFLQSRSRMQQVLLCIDCNGVQLFSEKHNLINSIPYVEMHSVTVNSQRSKKALSIKTVWMQEHRFLSDRATDLKDLLNYMLTGLRQRSRHAIAMKKSPRSDCSDTSLIHVNAGDYIIMHQLGWELDQKTPVVGFPLPSKSAHFQLQKESDATIYCYGENQRTWETGHVAMTNIYVLPTINPPKPEFIDAFSHLIISNENREWLNKVESIYSQRSHLPAAHLHRRSSSYSDLFLKHDKCSNAAEGFLENCSHRPASQSSDTELSIKSSISSVNPTDSLELTALKYTRLPLRRPFLRDFVNADRKVYDAALLSFCLIQTYMGDCDKVSVQLRSMPVVFLTDLLFGSALDCPPLRDEIFIQIMNQLTDNPKRTSENRGLELMWLATGIMVPSERVMDKLVRFLLRSPHQLASQCYTRLHHTLSRGIRKKPPHALEIAAIRGKKDKISQKIILPNDASMMVTVDSTTRAMDMIQNVARELNLTSEDQFALYLEVEDELRCIKSDEYLFDALRLTMPEIQLQLPYKPTITSPPPSPLYFMRKLWLNFVPGKYVIEDRLINFPQTMKNFLRGYYKCSLEQALELGTLIFIWQTEGSSGSQTSLDQILPKDVLSCITDAQWISIRGSTARWLLVVNASTISLVDEKNEAEAWCYSISRVAEFWQDNRTINYQLREANSVNRLVGSETTAYNVCDLVNCYIRHNKLQAMK
ncbi:Myosin-VIIa [Taenia solium]|eukprot:TsM_000180900 transcript=TsM_000180900 gene=TsM_000180900